MSRDKATEEPEAVNLLKMSTFSRQIKFLRGSATFQFWKT